MKKTTRFIGVMTLILTPATLLSACGKAPDPTAPVVATAAPVTTPDPTPTPTPTVVVGCPAGQFPLVGGCASGFADINSACYASNGQMTVVQGVQVCRFVQTLNYGTGYGTTTYPFKGIFLYNKTGPFPYLVPGDITGVSAYNPRIQVFPGDQLHFVGGAGWGSMSMKVTQYLGGLINVVSSKLDCNQIDMAGSGTTNQGQPAGFYATDGTEIFPITGATQRTINNMGQLKFGFNAPIESDNCVSLVITDLHVTRCFDSSGKTYTCQ
ncbi:hypothetical protein WDW37_18395 [Bdellovibrionota bacterium FG-1]